jgi:uncharacterized membrane protein
MAAARTAAADAGRAPRVAGAAAGRVQSIDLLRGIVVIVMALDHTREFFTSLAFQPEDLARSFPALFFTRWITHFCAPAFFFLAGTGAFFYGERMPPGRSLSRFLWTRGAWLIALELTIIDFAFTFSWRFQLGVVIWTLGWSMIVLAALVRARPVVIGVFAAALILFHDAFDAFRPAGNSLGAWVVSFLHVPIVRVLADGRMVGILYPLVPWAGVMAAGYLLGHAYNLDARARRRLLTGAGVAITVAFVALRATNWYGDPRPWTPQPSVIMTIASFLNCTKYPASLCFLLMTLGPCLVFLGVADGREWRMPRPVLVFGRVPLFFFVAHLYLLHVLAIAAAGAFRQPVAWLTNGAVMLARPPGYGHGLPFVYVTWVTVVLALYPACRWYAGVRKRHPGGWLSYL